MQHVKLARDRRKKRSRIKAGVFFIAILLIFTGILLTLKDNVENHSESSQMMPTVVDGVAYQSLNSSPKDETITTHPVSHDEATSYDDELQAHDDEVEEVKPFLDDLDDLPQNAQDALSGLLDAADQAIRITDQFSHTVTSGDTLKDVLELSGLEDDTAKRLIDTDSQLAHLNAGQQIYWILDKNDNLEYLNWLVSEKEERVYERLENGTFKRQVIEKKSVWRKD